MNTFNQSQNTENKKKRWLPRIVTFVITFLAILYFYPRVDQDSLYSYKVGQLWDHGDLVIQDSLVVPPDSFAIKAVEDSLRKTFVNVYTPVPPNELKVRAIIDSVDHYLKNTLQPAGMSVMEAWLPDMLNPVNSVRRNVRSKMERYYSGKVVSLEKGEEKPRKVILTEDNRNLTDTISSTDEILEHIIASIETENLPTGEISPEEILRFLPPNIVMNKEMSEERFKAETGLELDKMTRIYAPGYRIVKRGDLVDDQQGHMITLYTHQLLSSGNVAERSTLLSVLGQAIYILLLLGVLVGYMKFYSPRVWNENRNVVFILSLVGVFVVVSALVSRYLVLGLYLVPIVMVPILVQVFFHGRMALYTGVVVGLINAGMATNGLQYFLIEFVGIASAVFSLRDLTKRSQLLQTSLFVGLSYIVMYIAFEWMKNGAFENITGRMITVLAVNAVLTSVCYVLMFGVERLFGFTSNVTLIELTDVNTPLLRALSDQCPGTFNHVLSVSNLADDAARQIGANALLTRAGAMYHDIGKLANPTFFTENQHGVNPHDGLSPLKSAEIIISHIKEGLKRADKAGLPQAIRDFISEHHGKGQAKYFYYTYCRQHPDEDVDPVPFTYPGPNPRSRETSIVMMADAVEAASRSMKEHSQEAITELVNKIIDGQIADGLHNDSPLSFHDIRIIKNVFIRRLMTMYHVRVAYPDDPNKNKKSAALPGEAEERAIELDSPIDRNQDTQGENTK